MIYRVAHLVAVCGLTSLCWHQIDIKLLSYNISALRGWMKLRKSSSSFRATCKLWTTPWFKDNPRVQVFCLWTSDVNQKIRECKFFACEPATQYRTVNQTVNQKIRGCKFDAVTPEQCHVVLDHPEPSRRPFWPLDGATCVISQYLGCSQNFIIRNVDYLLSYRGYDINEF